ncbi:hypothetical protein BWQ96_09750 [Gracilariopsis chorda]|uniref:Uncharacterized protein n=1 Tax=Gracilariopsis chorda TaxID=448386 RepID=A0A2V3IEM1_9FLOR|nr:hypothetical protein BWQ96_09750 [Gracilariopsis chorda]|eukprot:PXF40535.1 hypothetical protein BWQ96_09750 [Gracilariopsis chorda]
MSLNNLSAVQLAKRYERAIKRFNDVDAMIQLGHMLLSGRHSSGAVGYKIDHCRGVQLLERAVKQADNPRAKALLALHFRDFGNKKQRRRVVSLLEDAFRQMGDPVSLHVLAKVLYDGDCGEKDRVRSVQLFERSLKLAPKPACMADFALVLLITPELHGEKARGLRLFKRAIKLSNESDIMHRLARLYHEGTVNLEPSFENAVKWYQRSIDVGEHCDSKYYLARLLLETPVGEYRDPTRAALLLEDALTQSYTERSLICLANVYTVHRQVANIPRAAYLLERAVCDFGSTAATVHLLNFCAFGFQGFPLDHQRAILICERHLSCTNPHRTVMMIMASILWSGSVSVRVDRERAIQVARQIENDHGIMFALMLRYDAPSRPADRKLAASYFTNFRHCYVNALLTSEQEDPRFDSVQAEQMFRLARGNLLGTDYLGWIPLYIRKSTLGLPYHGDERCFTKNVMRFCSVANITSLNLASLLLDRTSKSPEQCAEAITILECLMETELRDIAAVNLCYVLWYGVGGIAQDQPRALKMLVRFIGETRDVSARVLLASTLAERANESNWNLESSSWTLSAIRAEISDEEELQKLARLLSPKAWEVFTLQNAQGVCGE